MATKTVVCPECGEVLPQGRLSCPACGALVASVAGAPGGSRLAPAERDDRPTEAPAAPAAATAVAPTRSRRGRPKATDPTAEPTDPTPARASAERPEASSQPAHGGALSTPDPNRVIATAAPATPSVPPILRDWSNPAPSVAAGLHAERWDDDPDDAEATDDADTRIAAFAAAADADPGPDPSSIALPTPRPGFAFPSAREAVGGEPLRPAPAGAWLPPSAVFAATPRPMPAGVGAPSPAAVASSAASPASSESPPRRADDVALLSDLPFDAPDTLPGWLVAVGAGISVVSFLLPWSAVVLGSGSLDQGWTDTWGVASPSHLVVLLAALAVLALTTFPNRVPGWIRTGLAPLVLGGILLGLLWPYLFGGYGAGFGALAEAIGALLLVAGGILALRPARHGAGDAAV